MSDNLTIWNALRRPPEDALKGFKRAGGFTGTAIKPMWSIKAMTEQFGPCGDGWGIGEPSFNVVPAHNSETMVYCTVAVWHGSPDKKIFGVGGDRITSHIKANAQFKRDERWDNDDEAFKKAFTDAVTNALKHIGVGADIHMGLWDGSKYVAEKDDPPHLVGQLPASHENSRDQASRKEFDRMVSEIRSIASLQFLDSWRLKNVAEIEALPANWLADLRGEYSDKQLELKKGLAA